LILFWSYFYWCR